MSLSRYEEIVVRFAAARIAAGGYPDLEYAAKEAQRYENYFQERDNAEANARWGGGPPFDLPALLKPQAE